MPVWELKECKEISAMLSAGGVCVCVRSGRGSECSCFGAQWVAVKKVIGWESHPGMSRVPLPGLCTTT